MARAIDGDALYQKFEAMGWYDNADRDLAEDILMEMPTLTPPNELMEALEAINNAAVAYIEGGPYENDLLGLELAMEIDRLSRDFVRPPKGEEDK